MFENRIDWAISSEVSKYYTKYKISLDN